LYPGPAAALDAHGFELGSTTGDPACPIRIGCATIGLRGSWDAGMVFDYADDPLAEVLPDGRAPVLSSLATTNLMGAYSLGSLQLEAVVPVHVFGQDAGGSFTTLGDMRIGAQLPFLRMEDPRVPSLAARLSIWAPTGDETHHVGSLGPRAEMAVVASRPFGRIGAHAVAGVMLAYPDEVRDVNEAIGPVLGVGGSYRITDALVASLEASTATSVGQFPVEASANLRARLPMGAWLTTGAAAGIGEGIGASRWRAWVGLGFSHVPAPPPPPPPPLDPNVDRDGDGIPDVLDACPDQAETVDGFSDDDGCPELDGDEDGVAFDKDKCPREPIRPEQDPRYSDGCPKLAELSGDRIVITETVYFREGRAELLESSAAVLSAVRDVIVANPEVPYILIEGHTNSNGSDNYNLRLADARAFSVMRWLVEHGVPRERLLSKGFGEKRPVLPDGAPDALAANRRVEFRIVRVEELPDDARRIELPKDVK
jgi:outer membrane protein OmpA-like peptidoglycan-associated protein